MKRFAMLSTFAAVLLLLAGAAVAERNLESGSAGSEPEVGCDRVIAAKSTAGKKISREKLAAKLHTSVEKVNECLGESRHGKHKPEPKATKAPEGGM
jgi:hypothetical protein